MHICLLSTTYPPLSTEGIPRQRQILAHELARAGHNVHVVTCGARTETRVQAGVWVHQVRVTQHNAFSAAHPQLDVALTYSQALHEGLLRLLAEHPCDVLDLPFWAAPGMVTLRSYDGATVLWLQTSSAQLIALQQRPPTADERLLLALEHASLAHATGVLADSASILDAVRQDYGLAATTPTAVAHLGLPPLAGPLPQRRGRTHVEALIVGRLEQRKGTHLLFDLLPDLLRQHPQLVVRFVGRDNSAADGWQQQHQQDYPSFFGTRWPDLAARVIFESYVDEARLDECYRQADLLLVASLYESFGLIYLEAMRAALPIATFAVGGAREIFVRGADDGALLVPPGDQPGFAEAVSALVEQPELRYMLGRQGHARFEAAFRAEQMAQATLAFYERASAHHPHTRPRPHARTLFQVMEALDVGDAVSNITRRNAATLAALGHATPILARYTHKDVQHESLPIEHALTAPGCGLIFHYWGYNTSTWILQAVRGPKAVYYHNITPAHYFDPDSVTFHGTARGQTQLQTIADRFDLIIGDSRYNISEFQRLTSQPRPSIHLYPTIDAQEITNAPWNVTLLEAIRATRHTNIVFVGRIARNKRQDQLMRVFDHYYREINRHARLWLVGSDHGDPSYRAELEHLRESLAAREQIIFTGKVSELDVNAYYRAADVFVSASEHEGFGMPLIQAMALDIPVLAQAGSAVTETMGAAGVLIHTWDTPRVAELLHLVLTEPALRQSVIAGQRTNVERFSAAVARPRLAAIVRYLCAGERSPLITWPDAASSFVGDERLVIGDERPETGDWGRATGG